MKQQQPHQSLGYSYCANTACPHVTSSCSLWVTPPEGDRQPLIHLISSNSVYHNNLTSKLNKTKTFTSTTNILQETTSSCWDGLNISPPYVSKCQGCVYNLFWLSSNNQEINQQKNINIFSLLQESKQSISNLIYFYIKKILIITKNPLF